MRADPRDVIVVLAAVIERDGRFLVTKRREDVHLPGYWEFPGGKCEPDESADECLKRELREELGVDAIVGPELIVTEHAYAERTVRLHFRRCEMLGAPEPLHVQDIRWVTPEEMRSLQFPEADREVIEYLITARASD